METHLGTVKVVWFADGVQPIVVFRPRGQVFPMYRMAFTLKGVFHKASTVTHSGDGRIVCETGTESVRRLSRCCSDCSLHGMQACLQNSSFSDAF